MTAKPDAGMRPAAPIDAVLFDMDGTLSDTEAFWQEAEKRLVVEYGTRPPGEWGAEQIGASADVGAAYLQEQYGVRLENAEIQRLTAEHVLALITEGFDWRPGALELLDEVRAMGLPRALVTTSPRAIAQTIVGALPQDSFDLIIAGDDVTNHKPDPEPYLAAARRLGAAPDRCLVFEDSPNGAMAARRAGCFVVVVPSNVTVEEAERQLVLSSLSDVCWDDLAERL